MEGVRQIFEYIPAMALLSGLGIDLLMRCIKAKKVLIFLLIGIIFIPNLLIIKSFHPNQNVYFNFLIGGVSGAKKQNIAYTGNSFGNAYYQAIQWLNINSPKDSKLALIQGTGLNIPQEMLRADIQYGNAFWSGTERKGEYLLELTHDDPIRVYPHAWEYVETILEPVYEVKVDGVALAKLWKNDKDHSKPQFQKDEKEILVKTTISTPSITSELTTEEYLTRMIIKFTSCSNVKGRMQTSLDGQTWFDESETIPQVSTPVAMVENQIQYFFSAKKAKFVRFVSTDNQSCIFNKPEVVLYAL